ncbi:MAG: addiction module antidote protein [Bdellovibrionota bacterium]
MKKVKVSKKAPSVDYRESLIEDLKGNEKAQYSYLKASLEENGDIPEAFLKAVETVAKARGFSNFAKKTGLNRENLYRIFSNERTPRLESLVKILDALGFKLTIMPKKAS